MLDTTVSTEATRPLDLGNNAPADQSINVAPNLHDATLVRRYQRFAPIGALTVILISLVALASWSFEIPLLAGVFPSWVQAKANTAIALLALGICLSLINAVRGRGGRGMILVVVIGAGLATAIGIASLLEDILRVDFGIDQLLFVEPVGSLDMVHPGRPASTTDICLILTGVAMLVTTARTNKLYWLLGVSFTTTLALSMTALLGYFVGVRELYTLAGHSSAMSLSATVSFLLLAVGTICANPDHVLFQRLASSGSGGYMLRRLLPLVAILTAGIVGLRLWGQAIGVFATVEFGAATVTVATTISVSVILIWCAARLDDLDAARVIAEAETRHLNALLNQRLIDLATANRELETFSYSVSHDLRTPLRAIDGFSRILSEDYADSLDTEAQRIIGIVRDGTRKMAQLIDDILAFSRIGRTEMATAEVDMTELVREVLHELSPAIGIRELQFVIPALPSAHGDRTMLRRVWQNLLDNAVKYTSTRDAAVVEIGSELGNSMVGYYVTDNGVGFDMRYVDKLFGIFHRLHGPDEFSGTGIGLAIVKRIVARHGGEVWAKGKPDLGATFHFSLPALETGHD